MTSSTSSSSRFVRAYLAPWLLFTAAFGLLVDRLFANVLLPKSPGATAKIDRLLHGADPDEVTVFGSSRAEGNMVPGELGQHVFNYGLSGTELEVTEVLLDIELSKDRRAPILVNIDPDFFSQPSIGDVSAFIPFSSEPAIEGLLRRSGAYAPQYRIPGVRFYGAYELYLKNYLQGFSAPTKEFDRGASLEKNRLSPSRFAAAVEQRRRSKLTFAVPADKDARFQALLGRRPDRKIVIVLAPYHRSVYEVFDELPKMLDYLAGLSRAHPNVTTMFFDGRTYDDALFFDTSHLNAAGARAFSKELRQRLEARGISL